MRNAYFVIYIELNKIFYEFIVFQFFVAFLALWAVAAVVDAKPKPQESNQITQLINTITGLPIVILQGGGGNILGILIPGFGQTDPAPAPAPAPAPGPDPAPGGTRTVHTYIPTFHSSPVITDVIAGLPGYHPIV